jgi:thioredoxin-like negative regulator of GroEL
MTERLFNVWRYRLCLLLSGVLITWAAQGQGIQFINGGTLKAAFDQARSQRKGVFIEVYSPSCHTCASFKPTLAEARIGQAYNPRFVSYQLDVQSSEAQAFLSQQRLAVPSLPLFLFFDANSTLLYAGMPLNTAAEVQAMASRASNPGQRVTGYPARFKRGERGGEFLHAYAQLTRIQSDTVANAEVIRAYAKTIRAGEQTNERNFRVIQRLMLDPDNDLFQHFLNNQPAYRAKHDPKQVLEAGETVLMSTLFSSRAARLAPEQIQALGSYLRKLGLDATTVSNRTLLPELRAMANARQYDRLVKRADDYLNQSGSGAPEYTYLARYLAQQTNGASYLQTAVRWLKTAEAKAAKNAAERCEAQYELATVYLKLNQKTEARRMAQLALASAQAARRPTKRFEELLVRIS